MPARSPIQHPQRLPAWSHAQPCVPAVHLNPSAPPCRQKRATIACIAPSLTHTCWCLSSAAHTLQGPALGPAHAQHRPPRRRHRATQQGLTPCAPGRRDP